MVNYVIELNTTYILKHLRNAREDYLISNVGDQVDGQLRNRIEYYLHPETFKKCLMRSKTYRYLIHVRSDVIHKRIYDRVRFIFELIYLL